jgi:hypothetical protein
MKQRFGVPFRAQVEDLRTNEKPLAYRSWVRLGIAIGIGFLNYRFPIASPNPDSNSEHIWLSFSFKEGAVVRMFGHLG